MTRIAYFLLGLATGLYAWGLLTERLFPEPRIETSGDGSFPWPAT